MIVVLAEKPDQASKYAEAFKNTKRNDGYIEVPPNEILKNGAFITWGFGHLVTLKEPHEYQETWKSWSINTLPIIPEQFLFKVSDDKKKQFGIVKKLLQNASEIIVATDCDREGENIARSIIALSGQSSKPTKRLWINSLTEENVRQGFMNLKNGNDYIPYYLEAQARQISDWLVGLNATRLYTMLIKEKGLNSKEVFSVGRVQTPTLKLIYERQKEIENFKPKPYFELHSIFHSEKGDYKAKYKQQFLTEDELQQELHKHNISSINETISGEIIEVDTHLKNTLPPKLHSLSSIQTLANKKYKYTPGDVLKIIQELYLAKLVTYPRTDTQYITESEFEYLKDNLKSYQNLINIAFQPYSLEANKRFVDNSKVQEHYAIVPTNKIPSASDMEKLTKEQKTIYEEILKSAVAMFHAPYEYEETVIQTSINGMLFETKGKVEKKKGWKELYQNDAQSEDEKKEDVSLLPPVSKGMKVQAELTTKSEMTKPPQYYTEGQLITLMKTCGKFSEDDESKSILKEIEGLGTEATRSGIIDTLKRQKYIEVKKNLVYVTNKGVIICELVDGTMLSKPELTAKWESYLKRIGKKEGDKNTFINSTIQFTKKIVEDAKTTIKEVKIDSSIQEMEQVDHIALCPTCKKGHIIDKKTFYGCSDYKNGCKQTFPKSKNDKNVTKSHIKQICEKGKTTKKVAFKKKDSDKTYEAFLILNNGKLELSFQ
ncbi:DNA topoisomerase 3 [Gottfriedia solisilvae]|uniref:type IA DNA topoisomerase n=1 Tax=Gottfriedia solisilvae TaxID=1516104 RepID=UPI003D2EB679